MRKKTVFFLVLTLTVLAGAIYLPLGISNVQDKKLLRAVHSEKLSENISLLQESSETTDKLSILANGQESAKTTVDSSKKEGIRQHLAEEMETLVKMGVLYETEDLMPDELENLEMLIYGDRQDRVRFYSFTAFNDFYNMDVKMEVESSKIYEFTINYASNQSLTATVEDLSSAWAEYLDITFQDADGAQEELIYKQIKKTEVYYYMIWNEEFAMTAIEPGSRSSGAEASEGDMMGF